MMNPPLSAHAGARTCFGLLGGFGRHSGRACADYAASILSSSNTEMVTLALPVNGWLFIRTSAVIYSTRDGYENSRRRHLAFCDASYFDASGPSVFSLAD
jgi:hypothetical protein